MLIHLLFMAEAPIAEDITKREGTVPSSVQESLIFIFSIIGEDEVSKRGHSSSAIYSNAKVPYIWGGLFQN